MRDKKAKPPTRQPFQNPKWGGPNMGGKRGNFQVNDGKGVGLARFWQILLSQRAEELLGEEVPFLPRRKKEFFSPFARIFFFFFSPVKKEWRIPIFGAVLFSSNPALTCRSSPPFKFRGPPFFFPLPGMEIVQLYPFFHLRSPFPSHHSPGTGRI